MKKNVFFCIGLLVFMAIGLNAQNTVSLDEAVKVGAREIEARLARGSKIAVLNFNSPSQRFSNYVLDELMYELVQGGKLIVVDRANIETIRGELGFQMSGEVSDSSAQSIGHMLGAQSIVSGSIDDLGSHYRLSFRTIAVESAAIQAISRINVQKHDQIAALMGDHGVSVPATPQATPQASPGTGNTTRPADTGTVYRVGDTGPGGGIVFYDKGSNSDGWRYLEVAPAQFEFRAEWGARGRNVPGTTTSVGSGKRNTQSIMEQLNQSRENDRAAQRCTSIEINGYRDWFLPSKDELDLLYKNLGQRGLGGFRRDWYWSSSQNRNQDAWAVNFGNGRQGTHNKFDNRYVRAIRQF